MKIVLFLLILVNTNLMSKVSFQWSGVSGFILKDKSTTLFFDPNITMVRLWQWLPFMKVEPDEKEFNYWMKRCELSSVDAVITNHAHTDHILDAPLVLEKFGGDYYGSQSGVNYIVGMGIDKTRVHLISDKSEFEVGDFKIRAIKVSHPAHIMGFMLADGKIEKPFKTPAHPSEFKVGETLSFMITHPKGTILFSTVATIPKEDPLSGIKSDVLIATIAKRGNSQNFLEKRVLPTRAKQVIPVHYDDFFNPLGREKVKYLPFINPDEFFETAKKLMGDKSPLIKAQYCNKIDLF